MSNFPSHSSTWFYSHRHSILRLVSFCQFWNAKLLISMNIVGFYKIYWCQLHVREAPHFLISDQPKFIHISSMTNWNRTDSLCLSLVTLSHDHHKIAFLILSISIAKTFCLAQNTTYLFTFTITNSTKTLEVTYDNLDDEKRFRFLLWQHWSKKRYHKE